MTALPEQLGSRRPRLRGVKQLEREREFPVCKKCEAGALVPLSDYGREGAPIMYKAWSWP